MLSTHPTKPAFSPVEFFEQLWNGWLPIISGGSWPPAESREFFLIGAISVFNCLDRTAEHAEDETTARINQLRDYIRLERSMQTAYRMTVDRSDA